MNAVRVWATYCIVWIHTPRSADLIPTTVWARFAVPFFVAAAVFFVVRSGLRAQRATWLAYGVTRFQRIYVPFLAWSGIYLLFKCVKLVISPDQPNEFPGFEIFLVGSAFHLWFLPFILAVSLAVYAVTYSIASRHEWDAIVVYGAACLGLLICALGPLRPEACGMPNGVAYMLFSLPAVPWSFALSLIYARGGWSAISRPGFSMIALLSTVMIMIALARVERSLTLENLAGMGAFLVALTAARIPGVATLEKLAPLTYGVYLSHLLVIKVCETTAATLRWPPTPLLDIATYGLAVVGSTLITLALMRTRWLRRLAG